MSNSVSGSLAKLYAAPREVARWQKAQQQLTGGRYGHALSAYRDLVNLHPAIAQLWFELGIAAGGDLDFTLAHQAFQTSMALAPNDASLLVLIGQQYQRLRQLDEARKAFERAVAAEPDSIHARLTLAAWFERERRLEDAWACVTECLARKPGDTASLYFRAFLLQRRGDNAAATAALRSLIAAGIPDPNVGCSSRHLLGVALDELGEHAEALQWLRDAKAQLRQTPTAVSLQRTYDQGERQRRALLASVKAEDLKRWREEGPANGEPRRLVFLGGHPRSGTTLVEQMLGAHPQILAFDEPEAFTTEVANEVAPPQATRGLTLDGLNALSAAGRANLRRRYFQSLLREAPLENGALTLVDKNPSPTASLHLWLRVFPELKVIIPLRDPRDVVISCFFQNLSLTSANVNFLTLEGTARHFGDLMDVWLRMKELGGFDWLETRYEDVVKDLAGEGRRITQFIGLRWDGRQEKYYESARRKFVFAPTYHDVTKPVHQRAVGRWERYADALKPVMGRLERYCKALGYG